MARRHNDTPASRSELPATRVNRILILFRHNNNCIMLIMVLNSELHAQLTCRWGSTLSSLLDFRGKDPLFGTATGAWLLPHRAYVAPDEVGKKEFRNSHLSSPAFARNAYRCRAAGCTPAVGSGRLLSCGGVQDLPQFAAIQLPSVNRPMHLMDFV